MFLHSGETSAIVAPTLAKEPIMEKSPRPKAKPENLVEMNRLSRIMEGNESKYRKQELETLPEKPKAGRIIVRASGGKNPGANLKPIVKKAGGGMVGYKNGGCVMAGRGGNFQGEM